MLDIVNSYNIIIDTERNISPDGTGDSVNLPLGESPIIAGSNQMIKLNLQEFTIAKTWTDVNSTNNKFVVRDASGATEGTIPPNNYLTARQMINQGWAKYMADTLLINLGTAPAGATITYVVNNPPANGSIESDDMILDVTFTYSVAHGYTGATAPIVQCPISLGKCYQLLGGPRILSPTDTTTQTLLVSVPSTTTLNYKGYWNAQNTTENYCFVRINEQNTNTQTSGLSANSRTSDDQRTSMTDSNILGIVPINNDYCRYIAQTDNVFFTTILAKQVAQMRVSVTDSLGNLFPEMSPNQNRLGNRFFTAIIRVDIIQLHPSIPHSLHNPNLDEKTQARFSTEPATQVGIVNTIGKNGPQAGYYGNGFFSVTGKQIS